MNSILMVLVLLVQPESSNKGPKVSDGLSNRPRTFAYLMKTSEEISQEKLQAALQVQLLKFKRERMAHGFLYVFELESELGGDFWRKAMKANPWILKVEKQTHSKKSRLGSSLKTSARGGTRSMEPK